MQACLLMYLESVAMMFRVTKQHLNSILQSTARPRTGNMSRVQDLHTKSHYEAHSADSYEQAFFYEPGEYSAYLCAKVRERLGLDRPPHQRTLLDIGGGTGNFTEMLLANAKEMTAIVVDPFLIDSSRRSLPNIQFVKGSAEAMKVDVAAVDCWWRQGYHQVLLKEVVHHIDQTDRVEVFRGIRNGLEAVPDIPSLLIITRPQVEIDYPLWDAARDVWKQNQPSEAVLLNELREAGYTNVQCTVEAYPCKIELKRWQQMVKGRFWSTFSNFTTKELDAACLLIGEQEKHRVDADGKLNFEDRLLFISACK
jgi:hypothetical protein